MGNSRPTLNIISVLTFAFAVQFTSPALPFYAQAKKSAAPAQREISEETTELARLRDELAKSTKEYKAGLEELLTLYRKEVERADERASRTKELYADRLVTKRELEREEESAANARAKVKGIEEQLKNADERLAGTLAEATSAETALKLASQKKRRERTREGRVYYVRFLIVGEVAVYVYSGVVRGHVIKRGQKVLADSRR